MIARYSLIGDIRDQEYERLLEVALASCPYALFVVRSRPPLDANGESALSELEATLVDTFQAREWPGTHLLVEQAKVYLADLASASGILSRVARGLYDWVQPSLPEDLSLLRGTREPYLVTIAHEGDAYFELTSTELETLQRELPAVGERLQLEDEQA